MLLDAVHYILMKAGEKLHLNFQGIQFKNNPPQKAKERNHTPPCVGLVLPLLIEKEPSSSLCVNGRRDDLACRRRDVLPWMS